MVWMNSVLELLGKGVYGEVRRCIEIRTGKEYAMKRIDGLNVSSEIQTLLTFSSEVFQIVSFKWR